MSRDKPARIRASLLNIQNLVSISGPPSEDHNQASWHSVWNHSHYSDVTCKCGRRRCNLFFSLMPIGEGNVHQLPIDDVVMVLKKCLPSLRWSDFPPPEYKLYMLSTGNTPGTLSGFPG